jgi:hypothetical protein
MAKACSKIGSKRRKGPEYDSLQLSKGQEHLIKARLVEYMRGVAMLGQPFCLLLSSARVSHGTYGTSDMRT